MEEQQEKIINLMFQSLSHSFFFIDLKKKLIVLSQNDWLFILTSVSSNEPNKYVNSWRNKHFFF